MIRLTQLVLCAAVVLAVGSPGIPGERTPDDERIPVVNIPIANDTGEDIFFFVCGKHGCTKKISLKKDEIVDIRFYNDGNERALAAFDAEGHKVLSLFKFIPGPYCLLIEKNQTTAKTAEAGSKTPTMKDDSGPY